MTATAGLLEIRDLTVQYRRGHGKQPLTALREACLTVAPGETVALAGESGSGKSTLGNAVLGLVPVTSGTITFAGEDITYASPRRRRGLTQDIQAVFQDPYGSLNPVRAIGSTLAEPLLAHQRLGRAAVAARVTSALERVGLRADAAGMYPGQFSGGQRQRIAIARALMLSPRLIICDEPLSALDLSVQAQVLNLLRDIQRDLGVSYLFTTHDLSVIPHIAHRLVVLYRGRVVETGPASQVCASPGHPYTQELLSAAPVPDPAQQRARQRPRRPADTTAVPPASGCVFAPHCPHANTICTAGDPAVFTTSGGGSVACSRYPELTRHLTGPLGDQ
ncbi:MAG: ABC transporter ATP-binding protein [Actinobacteria bacterium]|nr:ABC transporter ATP-binding protein [Actinomycetota bacterium]MBO0784674.1 ABC transporter ATP-binding protein [Actinomycetota bacterium]MBO0813578.1 ABC transporter ATP-binding protein [Actinomycetota bacterium]